MRNEHVMTVRGPIDPDQIGLTSMHDHLFWDSATWWLPDTFEDQEIAREPLSQWNAGLARWNALGIRDNLVMGTEEYSLQRAELAEFKAAGGSCLVDPTCEGLDPQPEMVRQMSEDLDLHIVVGAGLYVHHSHPDWVHQATVDSVEQFIGLQVTEGLVGTDVRPGFLGEIGTSNPITGCELMVLKAAGRVGLETSSCVSVHTTAPGQHGVEIIDAVTSSGLDPERVILCHMDEVLDLEYHESVLRKGATVEFDTFGFEGYFARLWKTPSDDEKMRFLALLLERGWAAQVVAGHDVALKCQLRRFGGLGYDHIPRRIAPTLARDYGVAAEHLEAVLVTNPRRLLTRAGSGS